MQNTRVLIFRLWKVLSKRRQKQVIILMIFNIFTSIFELLTIGAAIPFLTVLSNPESISQNYFTKFLLNFFNFNQSKDLILPLAFLFAICTLLSTSFRTINMDCKINCLDHG